jgi:hypothetical protein
LTPTRTPFAGFLRPAPGDPLSEEGYAFQSENPLIADILAKLGAVTHKHDGHAAMVDPTAAHTVAAAATGGSIPASTPIHVGYTLTDASGGESLMRATIVVTTAAGYSTPGAPTAVPDYTAGTLLAGTPLYGITVTDGVGGETALGQVVPVTIDPGHANARALISGLTAVTNAASGSSSTAGWRQWKSVDGGSTWNLMATGAHTIDTYTDDGSTAGDCTVNPPLVGTTVGANKLTVTVPSAGQPAAATFFSIYADTTGQFLNPCLLGTYPVSDFDVAQVYTALTLLSGSPPAVSRCYPGADLIDPVADLVVPGAPTTGQVLTASSPTAAEWATPSGGGGGGAGAPVVHKFAFAYDTASLHTGATAYTPAAGDVLLDAWIEIDTAWDGTTPLGDFGAFAGGATGRRGNVRNRGRFVASVLRLRPVPERGEPRARDRLPRRVLRLACGESPAEAGTLDAAAPHGPPGGDVLDYHGVSAALERQFRPGAARPPEALHRSRAWHRQRRASAGARLHGCGLGRACSASGLARGRRRHRCRGEGPRPRGHH